MDSLLYPCILLASLSQIQLTLADCSIASISSPSASTLDVIWTSYAGATSYTLDLRLLDVTNVAPVSATVAAPSTEKLIQGLRSGSTYQVTLKVFSSSSVLCSTSKTATTVPASSQITTAKAVSSSSIQFEWSIATGADQYILLLEGPSYNVSNSFTSLKAQINNLQPSTSYKCSVFTSNVAGLGSRSKVKTMLTLIPPPGGVTVTATGSSSARVSWNSVAGVLQYQVNVTDNSAPAIAPVVVKTSSTVYDIRNLLPCSSFTMGVSSVNAYLDPGEPSNVNFKTSAIESPSSISVNYYCTSSMAVVNWLQVFGADSYRATVVDASGAQLSCTSASTSCQITSLPCGKFYFVTVTAVSSNCESNSQLATSFETVPCPPIGLTTYRECASNVIIFSWQGTNNTNYYVATSQGSDGQVAECYTTDTSCYFSNTACGITYQFSVYAVSGLCNSGRSASVNVSTAPCLPQNVKAFTDCSSYSLVTSWDLAPGALYYTVYAQGSRDSLYSCNSTSSSCSIDKVGCGESLSVWVSVSNGDCSDSLLEAVAETVPCTPENLLLVDECNADAVTLTWDPSNGGVFYIAMAVHSSGAMFTCQSTDPSCRIQGLHCGETYDTYVIATNLKCNSSKSKHVIYKTAPCPPSSVEAVRDCDFNQAWIKWQALQTGNYTAVITSKNGETLNCSTISNSCSIPNLRCGQNYSVTVQCKDNRCTSVPSTAVQIQSVPCVPTNISVARRCGDGSADVTWAPSAGGKNYTALAVSNRNSVGCTSNGVLCTITNLFCGQMYNVSVVATDNNCTSQCSQTVSLKTAPCTPLGVGGMVNCSSNTAVLSWLTSPNAVQYFGMAVGSDGHQLSCNVTSTSCPLSGLHCGQNYSFSVSASDGSCVSPASTGYRLVAAPCSPLNIITQLFCGNNTLLVGWDSSVAQLSYTTSAKTGQDAAVTCSTQGTTCRLDNLRCGQKYNVTVTASRGDCSSASSSAVTVQTAPCIPQNIFGKLDCSSNSLIASWDLAVGARTYLTSLVGPGMYSGLCSTANMSCTFSGLQCASQYRLSVASSDGICNSSYSSTVLLNSAPCEPQNVVTVLRCGADAATISWDASIGASRYTVLSQNKGQQTSYQTSNTSFDLSQLTPSDVYNISVLADDGTCNSTSRNSAILKTVPVPPSISAVNFDCVSKSASVSWTLVPNAVGYFINATSSGGHRVSCSSSTNSCVLTGLQCSQIYSVFATALGSQCSSSPGNSMNVTTAPCTPVGVGGVVNCSSNTAVLSWLASPNAVQYFGMAVGSDGHQLSCNVTSTSCQLSGLHCGQNYSFSVSASDGSCVSPASTGYRLVAAPCEPQNVVMVLRCGADAATISWDASIGASRYTVLSQNKGQQTSYQTSNTSIDLSQLTPSDVYNISVLADDGTCNSTSRNSAILKTVPVPPSISAVNFDCVSKNAAVSWTLVPNAVGYLINATSSGGHRVSCSSSTNSCVLTGLQCSQIYSVFATALGSQCSSSPGNSMNVTTAPCTPVGVGGVVNCSSNTAVLSWLTSPNAVQYFGMAVGSDGHQLSCNVTSTSCQLSGLHCGQNYSFSVSASDGSCVSPASTGYRLVAAPCSPLNIITQLFCGNNTLLVGWDSSVAQLSYTTSARTGQDAAVTCSTQGTSCRLDNLRCGQKYNVTVTASRGDCSSASSSAVTVQTAPCIPQNIFGKLDCSSNSLIASWDLAVGARTYLTSLVGPGMYSGLCSTANMSCTFSGLQCASQYRLSVASSDGICNSSYSSTVLLNSAPCEPQNVVTVLRCGADAATISWDASIGASRYTVLSQNKGQQTSYQTSNTSFDLSQLTPSDVYNISVLADDGTCNSTSRNSAILKTVPVPPSISAVNFDCVSKSASVSWTLVPNAVGYLINATSSGGHRVSCSSSTNSCILTGLQCSQIYSVFATALGSQCSSSPGNSMNVTTAPCTPVGVGGVVNCSSNTAVLSWLTSPNAVQYFGMAVGSDGHQLSCNVTSTSCPLSGLHCGQNYSFSVSASDGSCVSPASTGYRLVSAPCVPYNVTGRVDCISNSAWVSWQQVLGTDSYTVMAVGVDGMNSSCSTSNTTCNVPNLGCGNSYTFQVTASNKQCQSPASDVLQMETVPCSISSIMASYGCNSSSIQVVWGPTTGRRLYVATAQGNDFSTLSCNSTNSSCNLTNVKCGTQYSIIVAPSSNICSTLRSQTYTISTTPCTPVGIGVVNCSSNTAVLSWLASPNAVQYFGMAVGSDGHQLSYNVTSTSCQLSGLHCGQNYSFSVSASDGSCVSPASTGYTLVAAPCSPLNIITQLFCGNNTLLVGWDSSVAQLSYTTSARTGQDAAVTCSTQGTSCRLDNLRCGQKYNVTVTASRGDCSSASSSAVTVQTAPCIPQNIFGKLDCNSNSLIASWDLAVGARTYLTSLVGPGMYSGLCSTANMSCTFSGLQCASQYRLSVASSDGICNSSYSSTVLLNSAPCEPQNVVTVLRCGADAATISWDASIGASRYTVLSQNKGQQTSYQTSNTSFDLSQLTPSDVYNISVLADDGTCNSTSRNSGILKTVPVPPSITAVNFDCVSKNASVSWTLVPNAVGYLINATSSGGHRVSCSSSTNSCVLTGLQCSQIYSVFATALGSQCSSSPGNSMNVTTAPCTPVGVGGVVNCSSNTAVLSWLISPNAVQYFGMAVGSDGHQLSCNVTSTSCPLSGLHCGQNYSFSVSASDGSCVSPASTGYRLVAAPCSPLNIITQLFCGNNTLLVGWDSSVAQLSYTASARTGQDAAVTCSTQGTSCRLDNLRCGQKYNVTVTASRGDCSSASSSAVTVQTAPCIPQNIFGKLDCNSNSLIASWDLAVGARTYLTSLVGPGMYSGLCSTANMSCTFSGLQCASQYRLSVASSDGICNSSYSSTVLLNSAPCEPQNIVTVLRCGADAATISWDASIGASRYTVLSQNKGQQTSYQTSNTSFDLSQLTPSDVYNISVLADDGTCNSTSRNSAILKTVPVPPSITAVNFDCVSKNASVSWTLVPNAVGYLINATSSGGHRVSCSSSTNSCVLTGLQCSQIYSVFATALGSQCSSSPGNSMNVTTAPCTPVGVGGVVNCSSNTAVLSWLTSPNAVQYFGMAVGSDGHQLSCNVTSTSCQLSGLHCGQNYSFSVSASDGSCVSPASTGYRLVAAPCSPLNIITQLFCGNNTLLVGWDPSVAQLSYTASARTGQDAAVTCSTQGTSCRLDNLRCGQKYNVTVTSSRGDCSSASSSAVTVQTAPCIPQNIFGKLDCNSNSLIASWDLAVGARTYLTSLVGPGMYSGLCSTANMSCTFSGLQCASQYRLSVASSDGICNSSYSSTVLLNSAPCEPQNVVTVLRCGADAATISWDASIGASRYTVLSQNKGQQTSYQTSNTSFDLSQLTPSDVYNISVLADDGTCNSTSRNSAILKTVPVPPSITAVNFDCVSKSASVSWTLVPNAVGYLINATSSGGHRVSCSLSTNSCVLTGLQCSQIYSVFATALGSQCSSSPGNSMNVTTAPCTPVGVGGVVNCSSNTAVLSWLVSPNAVQYFGMAVGSDGHQLSCNVTSTSCPLSGLHCGQNYSFSVSASDGSCVSPASTGYRLVAAPCVPYNVTGRVDCISNSAWVSWQQVLGTDSYTVMAVGVDGMNSSCSTSNTTCNVPNLGCGNSYTFQVTASNKQCQSPASDVLQMETVPCSISSIMASYGCNSSSIQVVWGPTTGRRLYVATAQGNDFSTLSCNSTNSSCNLTNVKCGTQYSIIVAPSSNVCSTLRSQTYTISTTPCSPLNIITQLFCGNNTLLVGWDSSVAQLSYTTSARTGQDAAVTCSTQGTSCRLDNLRCGQKYNVTVTASRGDCSSASSSAVTVQTAPCIPQNIFGKLDCNSNSLIASWDLAVGARTYLTSLVGPGMYSGLCSTANMSCTFSGLQCASQYRLSVASSDGICNSSYSSTVLLNSAPCEPQNVVTVLRCGADAATISWDASIGASRYTVLSQNKGQQTSYQTSNTSFDLSQLTPSDVYNISVLADDGTCNSTSRNSAILKTVPVPPSISAVNFDCVSKSASVSWTLVPNAVGYLINATSSGGHRVSCSSSTNSCVLTGLQCSQIYSVFATALGSQCSRSPGNSMNVTTAPCTPVGVGGVVNCSSNTAVLSWLTSPNAVQYFGMAVGSDGHQLSCNVTSTSCQLSGLHCGQNYSFSVSASDGSCVSPASTGYRLVAAPCSPLNIITQLFCGNNTILVGWDSSVAQLSYTASARTGQDAAVTCSTQGTSCRLDNLRCGQKYNVTVTSSRGDCSSASSSAVTVQTAPCIPQNIFGKLDCSANSLIASWDLAVGARTYLTSLVGPGMYSGLCSTANMSCTFSGLQCASQYRLSVASSDGICNSSYSSTVLLNSAPCEPQNVVTVLRCGADAATISWDASIGASRYTVLSQNKGQQTSYQTSNTSFDLSQLTPSDVYNISVLADDGTCNSTSRNSAILKTVPVPPSITAVNFDCVSKNASVSWTLVNNAVGYLINATSSGGHRVSCSSSTNSCILTGLQCSQIYSVFATALGSQCSSSPGNSMNVTTAPCTPVGVGGVVNCSSNTAVLSWLVSPNAVQYFGMAVGSDGHQLSCNVTSTSCPLSGLHCGQNYSFSVSASDGSCVSPASTGYRLVAAPCSPLNIITQLFCGNNTLLVGWDSSVAQLSYTASARTGQDAAVTCSTQGTTCRLDNLRCGQKYNVTVTASRGDCSSTSSSAVTVQTAPCIPQNIFGKLDCSSNSLIASWDLAVGARTYLTSLVGPGMYSGLCSTANMSCTFSGLQCASQYRLSVASSDGICNSSYSSTVLLNSAPCEPQNVVTVLRCGADAATISWDASIGASRYTVLSQNKGQQTSYQTSNTSFDLSQLTPSDVYNISVLADDGTCNSTSRNSAILKTVPVPPSITAVNFDCVSKSASVSWTLVPNAVGYLINATSSGGHRVSCSSSTNSCVLTGLQCSQIYSVFATALGSQCSSSPGNSMNVTTAPCTPVGVGGVVNCSSNTAVLSWLVSSNAVQYFGMAVGSDGHQLSCNVTSTSCQLSGLHCGQNYSFSVSASDGSCVSPASTGYRLVAAPCVPYNVTGRVDCISNSAWVSWQQVLGTDSYTVMAVGVDGMNSSCSTSNTTCNVPNLGCGNSYTFQVTASNKQCQSPASDVLQMETVPCSISSIMASYGCNSSSIQVVWGPTTGRRLYVATAQGNDFSTLSCNSTNSSCNLTNVKCGTQYSIIVAPSSNVCSTLRSQTYTISTTPCVPVNISTQKLCDTNGALVSWNPSAVASSYVLTATAGDGDLRTCSSSSASCSLTYLHCSQTYSLSVTASSGNCSSLPSTAITFKSVPCQPTGLVSQVQCGNGSALLAWTASAGAVAYTANALTDSGVVRCQSSQQSCALQGLRCGVLYNFTVQATDGQCYSSASAPVQNGAAPCAPSGLRVQTKTMQNERQVIKASWNSVDCPGSDYLLEARGSILGSPQALFEMFSYWAAVLSFEMPFPCSSTYNVSVRARNLAGVGMPSNITTGTTAPCLPQHVVYTGSNTSAAVSWSASVYADTYRVYDVSGAARRQICTTTLLSCAVANVNLKDIMVTASNAAGESGPAYVGA
ncbi:uncharacterized protein fndc7rs1 isoform X2 [Denticeps clupeoides]|uniref:uncharacterized protein fndc7rs1 isoform X2 n=1 Tax=Denticeps clupeoides TaxID=299321 RepID=UPI0010A3B3E4|nr:uncharacterized protein LOC114788428 isoform X2 [Denticeps clupeoides]